MTETASERFYRQLEALKKRDFKEVRRIGARVRKELFEKKEREVNPGYQDELAGIE